MFAVCQVQRQGHGIAGAPPPREVSQARAPAAGAAHIPKPNPEEHLHSAGNPGPMEAAGHLVTHAPPLTVTDVFFLMTCGWNGVLRTDPRAFTADPWASRPSLQTPQQGVAGPALQGQAVREGRARGPSGDLITLSRRSAPPPPPGSEPAGSRRPRDVCPEPRSTC